MFYNYKILNVNNEEVLYLYISSMYEFSKELGYFNKPEILLNKVNDYIKIMDINFNGKKVMFVINDLIMASLVLTPNDYGKEKKIFYEEIIDLDKEDNIDIIDINSNFRDYVKNEITNDSGYIISNFVKMKNKDGKTTYIDLNNYIVNILSGIIPVTYEEEAIKAAAIVVRTNTFKELYENNYLDESNYTNIIKLKKLWNKNYNYYFNKLKTIVIDTSYEYLTFNNYFFNPSNNFKHLISVNWYDANKLAKKGYNYQDILGHFYPNTSLEIIAK